MGDEDRGQLCSARISRTSSRTRTRRPASRLEKGSSRSSSPRLGDQRPRQRHPLLLAAGELVRVALAEAAEADRLQRPLDPGRSGRAAQRVADVGGDVHVREERVVLEDHPDPPALGGDRAAGPLDLLAADLDRARVGALEAGDQPQRRRLAAAAGAEQGADRPLGDVEVEAVDGDDVAERFAQAAQAQARGSGWTLRAP